MPFFGLHKAWGWTQSRTNFVWTSFPNTVKMGMGHFLSGIVWWPTAICIFASSSTSVKFPVKRYQANIIHSVRTNSEKLPPKAQVLVIHKQQTNLWMKPVNQFCLHCQERSWKNRLLSEPIILQDLQTCTHLHTE